MIENLLNNMPEFLGDAIGDTVKLIPSLIIIFLFIEIFENFFAHKIVNIVSFSRKFGPAIGACLAIIPQCGFSVIMTTLFIRKYITVGMLLAVYIATSDEAIPILLANPSGFSTVMKVILIKLLLAIFVGYVIDLIIKPDFHKCKEEQPCRHIKTFKPEQGCCKHELMENKIKNIILHPIKHTVSISAFIFATCLLLNFIFSHIASSALNNLSIQNSILEIMFFTVFGLIPNCAVSVFVTMMYLKGIIGFSSVIAGLTTNAGLGLLILFIKKESIKSFIFIITVLAITGFLAGLVTIFLT